MTSLLFTAVTESVFPSALYSVVQFLRAKSRCAVEFSGAWIGRPSWVQAGQAVSCECDCLRQLPLHFSCVLIGGLHLRIDAPEAGSLMHELMMPRALHIAS